KSAAAPMGCVVITGIASGTATGEGLCTKFLANIRESHATCQVIRVFEDVDATHVSGSVEPSRDIETINTELILADLQTLERAIPRLEKEAKRNAKDKSAQETLEAAQKAQNALNGGTSLIHAERVNTDALRELNLLTVKPFIYVFNLDTD